MIAEEATSSSFSGLSAELGGMWSFGGPRNCFWKVDESGCTQSERTSSCDVYEHLVESLALEVVGQNWSSEVVSLFRMGGSLRELP